MKKTQSTFSNQHDQQTKWLLQIHKEYENICFQYRLKLKKPLIVIESKQGKWGSWDPLLRRLSLSVELISNRSWEFVLGILKHEMAHQIVSDVFLSCDSHGSDFLKACQMIAVPQEFSRAHIATDTEIVHWKHLPNDQQEDAVLRKIEKLLNLAQSANEHESLLAMANVKKLYEKHHLQKILFWQNQTYFSLVLNFKKKKLPATYSLICCILQNHFFVKVVFSDQYDAQTDESYKTIELFGSKQNLLLSEYVFSFLETRIQSLWENYKKEKNIGVKYKFSYQHGVLDGFLKKLDALQWKSCTVAQSQALVVIAQEDKRLQEFVDQIHPRLSRKGGSSRVYSDHFEQGIQEGKKINLNKPIHSPYARSSGKILSN